MKKILIVSLMMGVLSGAPVAIAKKVIIKDTAILRVKDTVFFNSDLKNIFNTTKKLDCLMGGSFLLEKIDLKIKTTKYPVLNRSNPAQNKDFFKRLLVLIQLLDFLKERSVTKDQVTIEKLIAPNKKLCNWKNNDALIYDLLSAEIFFQERFFLGAGVKNKELKKNSDIEQSIKLFLSTLEKRVEFHFYL